MRTEGPRGPAAARLRQAIEQYPNHGWPPFYLGSALWNDAAVSEELFRQAAEAFELSGDHVAEVYARHNRASLLFILGRLNESTAEVETALDVARASGDQELILRGRLTLAHHLARLGEQLDRVERLLRGSQSVAGEPPCEKGPYPFRRDCLMILANVAVDRDRPAEAGELFRSLAALARAQGDLEGEAMGLYGLARRATEVLAEIPGADRKSDVLRAAREAARVAKLAGHSGTEAKAQWILGTLLAGEEGEAHLERCVEVASSGRDLGYCLNALARHQARHSPDKALATVGRALEQAREAGDPRSEAFAWREAMRVSWAAASPEEALVRSRDALDSIERIRDLQPEGSTVQAGLFSSWADDYLWLAGRILEAAGRGLPQSRVLAESFLVSERSRARALTDWLSRTAPEATQATTDAQFAGLDEARAALRPSEALLSFQVAPWKDLAGDFGGGSWLLAITRDRVTVHRLPGRVEIRRAVRLFNGLVERRDGAEAGPAAHLYRQLLEPALAELPPEVDRLILIPDDALHRLPFAALRPAPDASPIGLRYELVRAPSATLWLHWRQGDPAPPAERPLLVLADPELPAHPAGETANPGDGSEAVQVAQVRGGDDEVGGLGPLPHAREEGRDAVRALGGGLLLVGPEASEAALGRLDLGSFGLVHLAAHAITDEDRPERSAVLLAAGPADGGTDGHAGVDGEEGAGDGGVDQDGRLESSEIARLHLDGRTVVLASCRSAGGTVLRGEGVMSLARAFFQAGAHGVVASLWPLRDDESAVLFRRFYRRVAEGATVGEALHGARREAIEAGEPAAAWAGLVVLGDGDLVPVTEPRSAVPGPAALAVLVVLALLAGAWLYRRSAT